MNRTASEPPDLVAALAERLALVPPGRVATFGDLARSLGAKSAAVWVGTVLRRVPPDLPPGLAPAAHRAVRATGETVSDRQRDRLRAEGVAVDGRGRVDIASLRFTDLPSDGPLTALAREQDELAHRVRLEPLDTAPDLLAGVDVAYPRPGVARGACVLVPVGGTRAVWRTAIEVPVRFPYISGFLGYREVPVLRELLAAADAAGLPAAPVLVDGSGVLHPRRLGDAAHLGVLADRPTVGIAKRKLCGTVRDDGVVLLDGEPTGAAVRASDGNKPIFVSPGHRITLPESVALVRSAFAGHRLPEPVWLADRLSKGG